MTQKELYKAAQLLKAGQVVEISGDTFQAVRLAEELDNPICYYCDLDSICWGDVFDVCRELESVGSYHWLLKLAHPL